MAMIADDPVRQLIGRKNGIAAIWMHRNLEAAADQTRSLRLVELNVPLSPKRSVTSRVVQELVAWLLKNR